ncbi:MAG: DUF4402 domain-containing protein [Bacteroidota bacterium]
MKKLTLLIALLLIGLSANALAANPSASASASATAVIVTPISISQSGNNLSFGNIVASVAGGTVVVDPSGTPSYSGVSVPSTPGTITAAAFSVTGSAGLTYAITLPGSATLNSGGNSMTLGTFTSSPSATGTLDGSGAQALTVGATLTVGASQAAGTYTGTFSVTVAYN